MPPKSSRQLDREIAQALASRSHATKRDLSAVEDALGYTPDPRVVERAEAAFGDYTTNELRREIQRLEDEFEMAGGRGVGLADRLDAARIALALRGAKRAHAARLGHRYADREHRGRRNPGRWKGTEVQSLLFARPRWTPGEAKQWAKDHAYRSGEVDVTDNYVRLRQFDPVRGRQKRTITFGDGIKAIIEQVK